MPKQGREAFQLLVKGRSTRPCREALVLVSDGQPGGLLRQRGAARGANWSRTGPTVHPQ
jgi:hypothetical protein